MLKQQEYRHYRLAAALSVAMALLVGLFLAFYGKEQSFLLINQFHSPAFDRFFFYFTYLGDGIMWVPLLVYLILKRRDFLLAAVVALLVSTLLTHVFKQIIFPGQLRPWGVFSDLIRQIDGLELHRANSFPSGHTSTAFTIMLLLVFLMRRMFWTIFLPLVAFFVGYSRVYLGQHFVTDVFAGMLVGIFSSFVALMVQESFRRRKALDEKQVGARG